VPTEKRDLAEKARDFLGWLNNWYINLKPMSLHSVISDPTRVAICSVDMLNGFCYEGKLSSSRAAACARPVANLFLRAHALGVRNFILIQEWHSEQAEEFNAYGPHCIHGTLEAETIPELTTLPFAREFVIIHKNSLHTVVDTGMEEWLLQHSEVDTFIVVGVCTDLCTYDLATDLKLRANARDVKRRVIVPANAVNTYDLPVEIAKQFGALPHDGEFLHVLFLYMMSLNKIEIVRELV
jgi:nicotinamidase-related amidase